MSRTISSFAVAVILMLIVVVAAEARIMPIVGDPSGERWAYYGRVDSVQPLYSGSVVEIDGYYKMFAADYREVLRRYHLKTLVDASVSWRYDYGTRDVNSLADALCIGIQGHPERLRISPPR